MLNFDLFETLGRNSRPPAPDPPPEGKEPVITEVVAFELSAGSPEPVVTSMAGFEPSEPVITKVSGFGWDFGPQRPGERTTIPADLRKLPAVLRQTPGAFSIRRRDQPKRPSAITCSRFSLLKTLPMQQRLIASVSAYVTAPESGRF
jgi:hypothetical protein